MRLFSWILRRMKAFSMEESTDLLRVAGLDEQTLRGMDPDDRVAALEAAGLDPYDFIYLAY